MAQAERAVDTLIAAGYSSAAISVFLPDSSGLAGLSVVERYEGQVKGGGTLLLVHCDTLEQISRTRDLLKGTGATDIASTGEASQDDGHSRRLIA
jgi:hypothetical protein